MFRGRYGFPDGVVMVGDGGTDYEARRDGAADVMVGWVAHEKPGRFRECHGRGELAYARHRHRPACTRSSLLAVSSSSRLIDCSDRYGGVVERAVVRDNADVFIKHWRELAAILNTKEAKR